MKRASPAPAEPRSADDPDTAPVVMLRESSIVSLAAHGVLDADQVAAAFHFRRLYETAINLRARNAFERVDESRQWVDAERSGREEMARRQLDDCRYLIGTHGFALLVKICGEGYHVRDLHRTRRDRDTATDLLRIHLSELALMWGQRGPA